LALVALNETGLAVGTKRFQLAYTCSLFLGKYNTNAEQGGTKSAPPIPIPASSQEDQHHIERSSIQVEDAIPMPNRETPRIQKAWLNAMAPQA